MSRCDVCNFYFHEPLPFLILGNNYQALPCATEVILAFLRSLIFILKGFFLPDFVLAQGAQEEMNNWIRIRLYKIKYINKCHLPSHNSLGSGGELKQVQMRVRQTKTRSTPDLSRDG